MIKENSKFQKVKIKTVEKDMTKKEEDMTAVEFIEKLYPKTSKSFKVVTASKHHLAT